MVWGDAKIPTPPAQRGLEHPAKTRFGHHERTDAWGSKLDGQTAAAPHTKPSIC